MTAHSPIFSVIVPFDDSRGRAEHLASWTREQSFPEKMFEVVAVVQEGHNKRIAEVRKFLRPHDRLVVADPGNRFHLFNGGAQVARGEFLMLTEDHCLAHPDCLAEIKRHLDESDCVATVARTEHVNQNNMARLEQREFEDSLPHWLPDDAWDKVRIRGFAVRRDAFERLGGFPDEYGYFAESALAAKMHQSGMRIGYADRAVVRHVNTTRQHDFVSDSWSYATGQCTCADDRDAAFRGRYLGTLWDAADTRRQSPGVFRTLVKAWWNHLRMIRKTRDMALTWHLTTQILGSFLRRASGNRVQVLAAMTAAWWNRIGVTMSILDHDRQYLKFLRMRQRVGEWARAAYLVQHPERPPGASDSSTQPLCLPARPVDFTEPQACGFYRHEVMEDRDFRWTAPLAVLSIDLEPGEYEGVIDTGMLRGPASEIPMALAWNGHVLKTDASDTDGRITFTVREELFRSGEPQHLIVMCCPLPRCDGHEHRRLGLPVFGIDMAPIHAALETPRVKSVAA